MTRNKLRLTLLITITCLAILQSAGCEMLQNRFGQGAPSSSLTTYNGPNYDQEVNVSPADYVIEDAEPLYVCIEEDDHDTILGINSLRDEEKEDLLDEIREAVTGVRVRTSVESRLKRIRPSVRIIAERESASRCDMYVKVAVTTVNYSASSESSTGQGGSRTHGGRGNSAADTEYLDVRVRVRFFDHTTDELVAVGYGRAEQVSKSGSSGFLGRSGDHSGSGSSSSLRSSILSAAHTNELIGQAASAAIIDALSGIDDHAQKYNRKMHASSTDPS